MNILKEVDFRKEIKDKPASAYLFFGDEDYMKSFALKSASDAICPDPSFSFFNEMKFDALTYSPDALLDAIMPYPMGAERKLIVVSGLDLGAMKQSEIDNLCSVISRLDEYDYNTVIINVAADRFDYGNLPKRPSSLLSKLSEYMTPVFFDRNTPSKLAGWVGKHFSHNGAIASPEICALTVDRCGRNMYNLASEVDKISFYVLANGRQQVTREDVINIATSAEEFDAFALTNAIGARRRDEALRILRDMKFRRLDPIIVMSEISKSVYNTCAVTALIADGLTQREVSETLKMHEYAVSVILRNGIDRETCNKMLEKCRQADLDIKTGRDGYAILEKLICSI